MAAYYTFSRRIELDLEGVFLPVGARYSRAFFARSCLAVAPDLLGAYLVRNLDDGETLVGRIVEVEAYSGDGSDPSAHSHRGPTARNRAMFGPAGRLYVYRIYGIHTCANVVCEPAGHGAAVLLRAVEPILGRETMWARRGIAESASPREIANGPGKLCAALGISLDDYGRDLLRGPIELRRSGRGDPSVDVATSRRIGISKGEKLPWRFFCRDSEWVSGARPRRV